MDLKIMYGALMFVAGWFYFYICLRQLIFDFTVGYPLIKKFGSLGEDVFVSVGARRLNTISVSIWLLICAGLAIVVFRFCPLWLLIPFWVGAIMGILLFIKKLGPKTKSNFEAWLHTYYRFMPHDELRMACYHADLPKLRAALRGLGSDLTFEIDKG